MKNLRLTSKKIDWFGVKITKKNYITKHHCIKKVYWQIDEAWNIAYLSLYTHRDLHELEYTNRKLYNEINRDLLEIDRTKPIEEETQKKLYKKLYGSMK